MLTYNFTNIGSDSLYEYLYKCIKNDILLGSIKAGEKLPSKRSFAKNLGISVITVENAYEQLIAEGYIYSIPKKGFYVTDFKQVIEIEKKTFVKEMVPLTGGEMHIWQILQVIRQRVNCFHLPSGPEQSGKF